MLFATLAACARHLFLGGILIYPTETFCAIGCRIDRPEAIEAIFALKGRGAGKPLPVIAGDLAQAGAIADLAYVPPGFLAQFWPGPLSLVLPATRQLCPGLVNASGKVCLRVSASRAAAGLALGCKVPIVATSANFSGMEPAARLEAIDGRFLQAFRRSGMASGLYMAQDEALYDAPSTVLESMPGKRGFAARVLREGCIAASGFAGWFDHRN